MKPQQSYPLIAREGWVHVGLISLFCLAASMAFGWWALPLWLLWLFVVQFFRDPAPIVPTALNDGSVADGELVISPANGRVVALVETEDPYQQQPRLLVSVFMNVFSIHSNRVPVAGVVRQRSYFPGKFLNAALEKSSSENERNALIIEMKSGVRVTTVQIAGLVARRILCSSVSDHVSMFTCRWMPEFVFRWGIRSPVARVCWQRSRRFRSAVWRQDSTV